MFLKPEQELFIDVPVPFNDGDEGLMEPWYRARCGKDCLEPSSGELSYILISISAACSVILEICFVTGLII